MTLWFLLSEIRPFVCCCNGRLRVDWLRCTSTRTSECLKNVDTETSGYLGDQLMDGEKKVLRRLFMENGSGMFSFTVG